jgi:hypothetical protein
MPWRFTRVEHPFDSPLPPGTVDRAGIATLTGLSRSTIRIYLSTGRLHKADYTGDDANGRELWDAVKVAYWERHRPKRADIQPYTLSREEANERHGKWGRPYTSRELALERTRAWVNGTPQEP